MFKILLNKILSAKITDVAETMVQSVSETVPETVAETGSAMAIKFTTENLSEALLWFITGMVGVFLVIGIIIIVVSLLNKAGSGKKKDK
ncbi:MAG: hypothetical protein IJ025_00435 [Clostridia bacterium]|nr:hypothetical protein [Clostridia bacterium]